MLKNFFEESNCRCSKDIKPCCPCNQISQQNNCAGVEPFFCPRLRTYVLRGPRGFTGPRGPQGLPGVNSVSAFGSFSSPTAQVVSSLGRVMLNNVVNQSGNILLSGGEIILQLGTYFVSYNLDASQIPAGTAIFGIGVNNVIDQNSKSSTQMLANSIAHVGATTILSVGNNTTLAIQNLSPRSVSTQNVSLSILKIA